MISYSEREFSVLGYPIVRRDRRIHKEKYLVRERIALKADLCRYNAFFCRGVINGSYRHGRELCTVFSVEDNAVDRVRITTAPFSV